MQRLLILICAFGIGCKNNQETTPLPSKPIEVWLNQSVEKILGVTWLHEAGKLVESKAIEDDSEVLIHFPSGRKLSTFTKATFVDQKESLVTRITVTPLAEVVTFDVALSKVKAFAEELEIQNDDRIKLKLRSANSDPPKWNMQSFTMGCPIDNEVETNIEIRPSRKREHWLVSYDFNVRAIK